MSGLTIRQIQRMVENWIKRDKRERGFSTVGVYPGVNPQPRL
ncbi:MAG: hypothetical protein QXU43_08710 [Thermoproteota archaeon]